MGIFDIFKKKQKPVPSFDIAPPPLDIPPPEPPAEYSGNAPVYVPEPDLPPVADIEGKISVPSELPSLPPLFEQPIEKKETSEPLQDELLATALPEFPEIPQEPPFEPAPAEVDLPELPPLVPPPSEEFTLPQELPHLSIEALGWPTSPSSTPSPVPEHSFVFVHSNAFTELLESMNNIKDAARRSAKTTALLTLKNTEDSDLNRLQGDLESIQRKLLYVDTVLFEKQTA